MTSERVTRIIERLLDKAEKAAVAEDWTAVQALTDEALELDSDLADALALRDFAVPRIQRVQRVQRVSSWKTRGDANQVGSDALARYPSKSEPTKSEDEPLSDTRSSREADLDVQLSARVQRLVEAFLDQAEASVEERNWERVTTLTAYARDLDPANTDAESLGKLAEKRGRASPIPHGLKAPPPAAAPAAAVNPREFRAETPISAALSPPTRRAPTGRRGEHSSLSFGEAVGSAVDNYATFDGRASRAAYWYWALFSVLFQLTVNVADVVLGTEPLLYAAGIFLLQRRWPVSNALRRQRSRRARRESHSFRATPLHRRGRQWAPALADCTA